MRREQTKFYGQQQNEEEKMFPAAREAAARGKWMNEKKTQNIMKKMRIMQLFLLNLESAICYVVCNKQSYFPCKWFPVYQRPTEKSE